MGVDKKFGQLVDFWAKLGRIAEEFTDVLDKKMAIWSKIFKKWAAKSLRAPTTFWICGQKPKNF